MNYTDSNTRFKCVCKYTVNIQYIHLKNNDISVISQGLIIIMRYQFS